MRPPCGGRTPTPRGPRPGDTGQHNPRALQGGAGARAAGQGPRSPPSPRARGPRGLYPSRASPSPDGPSGRGKQRSRRRRSARLAAYPPQPPGPACPHRSPSPRADCPRPLDGRPGRAGASGALQGRLGPHSPLQHQDDGEPLGNLAESGAMQTLELRCGHSMATRRAARRTEAPRPGEGGEGRRRDSEGSAWGRSSPGARPTAAASRALASKKAKASGRRVFPPAVSRSPAPENVVLRHPGSAATPRLGASVFPGRPLPSPGQAPPTGPAPPPYSPAG